MSENCCCGTNKKGNVVDIEYLYLDLDTCERCVGTDKVLEGVLDELRNAFKTAGYSLEYRKVKIETAEMAKSYRFLSSPTIRVNGRDICNSVQELTAVVVAKLLVRKWIAVFFPTMENCMKCPQHK